MFNCVPVIITYDNFSRFFPPPPSSFLPSLPWTSLFPCFHTGNVDTGHCPCATRGTKRWINTRLNKQLLSLLFSAVSSFFSLSLPLSILPILLLLDGFHALHATKEYTSYNCGSNVSSEHARTNSLAVQNSRDRDKMAGNVSVIAFRSTTEQIVAG